MSTVLEDILLGVRQDLAVRMSAISSREIMARAQDAPAALPASAILASRAFSVIAEVKRSSPSKGHLADIPEPARLAAQYENGGAQIISVLTESRRFGGSLADLDAVRQEVTIPILRKDFMVEEYQIWESRAHGADVILLIVASLDDAQLRSLNECARNLGMSVLVEVHDAAELERALAIEPTLVGVNARNLKTLHVDLNVCHTLIPEIPRDVVAVAESGISTISEVRELAASGARAILVGEALVTTGDAQHTVREWTQTGIDVRSHQGEQS